jgi:hypothetical protein
MNTEQIVKLAIACLIVAGYGVVLCVYMLWGPTEANRAVDALIGGLSAGYLMVLQNMFGSK